MTALMQTTRALDSASLDKVVRGNTEFALDLYHQLRTTSGNLFYSPYSISTAFAMTYAGARAATATQMARTLHFSLEPGQLHPAFAALQAGLTDVTSRDQIELNVANALWPQVMYPFLEEFMALMKTYYGVFVTPVNFGDPDAAREKINTWVEEKTRHKIKELIPPGVLDNLTRLVLANAIYFKGHWASQFDKALTEDAPFFIAPTEPVRVPMMAQQATFRYRETDTVQILELPYVGRDLSMVVFLLKAPDELADLEAALTAETLNDWTGSLWETEVAVFLPRFKISCGFKLNDSLIALGMVDAFSRSKANFAGMDGLEDNLFMAAAFHKAFIDVNEEGTEAAAATAVIMKERSAPEPVPVFRADHPFVFVIRDNHTGSILFMGRVTNPLSETG